MHKGKLEIDGNPFFIYQSLEDQTNFLLGYMTEYPKCKILSRKYQMRFLQCFPVHGFRLLKIFNVPQIAFSITS